MGQVARVVVSGYPHHITQRGNRRQQTFFCGEDYRAYIDLMSEWCSKHGVDIWAYCLMPNHVHLIAVPQSIEGLARAIGLERIEGGQRSFQWWIPLKGPLFVGTRKRSWWGESVNVILLRFVD
jgi:REP element-mobilizing transposase RayT